MNAPRLTTREYWDSTYAAGPDSAPLEIAGFQNFFARKLLAKLEPLIEPGARVLEVGAGNSAVLTHLAAKFRERATFTGLDYSQHGCDMLTRRANAEKVSVRIVPGDLFDPDQALLHQFDVIYSLGVVEHFRELAPALRAKRQLLAPGGHIVTIIPNMAGLIGSLTRRYNRAVYDAHNPHDLQSFHAGHREAGLRVESSGYVCSTNFGVLSSCFRSSDERGWNTYLWLSRLTKALWFFEDRFGELPHSRLLSPYLFATSRAVS